MEIDVSDRQHIAQLIEELAADLGIPEMKLGEDGTCALQFDGTLTVYIAHLEAERNLTLFCYLGQPEGDRAALFQRLLEANFFWSGAAGATLSLERESGGVVLMDRVATHGLHLPEFMAVLERFVNAAESWRTQLGGAAEEDSETVAVQNLGGHIRA